MLCVCSSLLLYTMPLPSVDCQCSAASAGNMHLLQPGSYPLHMSLRAPGLVRGCVGEFALCSLPLVVWFDMGAPFGALCAACMYVRSRSYGMHAVVHCT